MYCGNTMPPTNIGIVSTIVGEKKTNIETVLEIDSQVLKLMIGMISLDDCHSYLHDFPKAHKGRPCEILCSGKRINMATKKYINPLSFRLVFGYIKLKGR